MTDFSMTEPSFEGLKLRSVVDDENCRWSSDIGICMAGPEKADAKLVNSFRRTSANESPKNRSPAGRSQPSQQNIQDFGEISAPGIKMNGSNERND
jgi:hypothetical protein